MEASPLNQEEDKRTRIRIIVSEGLTIWQKIRRICYPMKRRVESSRVKQSESNEPARSIGEDIKSRRRNTDTETVGQCEVRLCNRAQLTSRATESL